MKLASGTRGAVAVRGDAHSQRVSAQMRDLAQKINGRFRIVHFQFAISRTHATKRLNPAIVATSVPCLFLCARLQEKSVPAFLKRAISPVVRFLMGDHAD